MKIAFAYDGSQTALHALKWGLLNLVHPNKDECIIFCVGITSVPDYTSILEATFGKKFLVKLLKNGMRCLFMGKRKRYVCIRTSTISIK